MIISSIMFLAATIIVVGIIGELIFVKTDIPDILWLMILGILAGPVMHIINSSSLWTIAPLFSAIALIVILFEGGLHLNIYDVIKNTPAAFSLSAISFIIIGFAVAGFYYLAGFLGLISNVSHMNALILGATLAGTSSILLVPLMLKSKYNKKILDLLGLESTYNDVFVIVAVIALLKFAVGSASSNYGIENIVKDISANFAVGIVVGALAGIAWLYIMRFFRTKSHELIHHYMLTFAALLLLYVGVEYIGGSSALAVLMFGLVLGNASQISSILKLNNQFTVDIQVRFFNSQVSFFVKTFFFAFMGMMFIIEPVSIIIGILLCIVIFIFRYASVKLFNLKAKLSKQEVIALTTLVPKGLAAAVVSIMPMQYGLIGTENFTAYTFTTIMVTTIVATVSYYFIQRNAKNHDNQNNEKNEGERNLEEVDKLPIIEQSLFKKTSK